MDIDSSIQNKPQTAEKMYFHISDISPYHSTSESSDLEFSGGSPATFTAAATPSPPYQETRLPLFLQNVECSFPCTSLSLMQGRDQSMEAMRETIFRMAVMQPIHMEPSESSKPPKRKNVRISKDPQSVAARHRRERISHRIRTLQRMVPGGTKLDTASMLDEAVHYLKFLKKELQSLEEAAESNSPARIQGCWSFSGGINFANA